jgi:hypothetical protein
MSKLATFEYNQTRAREARRQAHELRELHKIATCGLTMQYAGIHYGTRGVPVHFAARIADMYLVWAAEYDAIADGIEADLQSALDPEPHVSEETQ